MTDIAIPSYLKAAPEPPDLELPPRLRIEGSKWIKPNGKEFFPVGVSWGSYGRNLEEDGAGCAAMHANCIRDLLRWHGEYGDPAIDARDNNAVAFVRRTNIAQIVREMLWITSAQMWTGLALDSNCTQGGAQSASMRAYCDPYALFGSAGRNGFTDRPLLKLFVIAWQALARIARPIPRVAWYELLPEPLPGEQYGPQWAPIVADVYRFIIEGVREVDPDTPFLIGPRNAYDSDFLEEIYLPERTDVGYTANILSGKLTNTKKRQKAIRDLADFRDRHNVPVYINQLGRRTSADPDLSFMRAALQECNDAGIPFAWWQNRQNSIDPGEYALHYPDGQGGWIDKTDEIECLSGFMQAARQAHS